MKAIKVATYSFMTMYALMMQALVICAHSHENASLETQEQIVGARESLNRRRKKSAKISLEAL